MRLPRPSIEESPAIAKVVDMAEVVAEGASKAAGYGVALLATVILYPLAWAEVWLRRALKKL
ncbi:hypothetical protein D3C87_1655630 [compost metagenome]